MVATPMSAFCIGLYGSGFSAVCGSLLLVCLTIVIGLPGNVFLLAIGLILQVLMHSIKEFHM